jgi:hypothetical protein
MRQYSLSSHRGSIDIVKTVVVLTDFQIGTLDTFLCQCIQNFLSQNSAPQAWNRGIETWPSRGAVSLRLMAQMLAIRESQHELRVWGQSILRLSTYI